jgi:homocitrate synthase NifV
MLGRKHRFVLGKHSGIAGLRHELAYLGLEMTPDEERELLNLVRAYAENHKKPIPTFTLVRLAAALIDGRAQSGKAAAAVSLARRATLEAAS